jgi:uncharacterized membrane protein HdeD (DUF308 family)
LDATPTERDPLATNLWWLLLLAGVAASVLGMLLIFRPFKSVVALAWLLGLFLIVSGFAGLLSARRREYGMGIAVLSLVVGIVLLVWPDITVQALAVLAGIGYVVRGVLRAAIALVDRREFWLWILLVGLLGIALGVAIIVWPDVTVAVIGVVLGIGALVTGIGEIVAALELRKAAV